MTNLAKLVLAKTGLTLKDFCEQHLKSEYKTFQMRSRKKRYYPAEVIYTCWFLGVTCQEAFGYPYWKLVMFQGKNGIPEKVAEMWKEADMNEKHRLLSLVGLTEFTPQPPAVKPEPVVETKKESAPVIRAPKKEDVTEVMDFFQDIEELDTIAPQAEKATEAPKNTDPLQGLFIETY